MSYSTVYGFTQGGSKITLGETHNSWRGAAWIWNELCQRYLGEKMNLSDTQFKKLGEIESDMSDTDYYCWAITHDRVLVGPNMMLTVAEALENFTPGTEALAAQARAVREAHEQGMRAVVWWHTSVSDDLWRVYISEEEWVQDALECHEGEVLDKKLIDQLVNEFELRDMSRDFDLDRDFDESKHFYLEKRDVRKDN